MAPIPILIALGVAVVGILSHRVIVSQMEAPPLDLGCGSEKGSMFDFIAGRYDSINRVMSFRMDVGWRRVMVGMIQSHLEGVDDPRIVDVATGTADVALMTSQMIPSATIIGVDPSNGMLDVGRRKVTQRNRDDRISLQWADARDLSQFEPDTFDAGTMAFGIRNVPERDVAMCEIYKVMKPGSLFCIMEFSEPDVSGGPLEAAASVFIRHVVPFVGGILSGQPKMYKHLQNSIKSFPSPEDFRVYLDNLPCTGSRQPSFVVDEVKNLNFRSVQIYAIRSLKQQGVHPVDEEGTKQQIPEPSEQIGEEEEEPMMDAHTAS
jgi:demethylmenaquinone methyltransferase / 2-methoxy-6-polyprenyl-1,4-benzoquinol methylase